MVSEGRQPPIHVGNPGFDYDGDGQQYATVRRADPRIAGHIQAALGDARTVLNVGAGAGSYEPADRYVVALEPSAVMRRQRPAHLAPALAAAADEVETEPAQPADEDGEDDAVGNRAEEEGPIHRRLIRASLPKIDGAPPPTRQIPEFTIRQPGGRPTNRFRPRHQRGGVGGGGGQQFQGNRSHGGGNGPGGPRGGGMRSNGGRPPQGPGGAQMRRHGPGGRKRSK